MYLSRIELDPIRRETIKALSAPHMLHGAVESSFGGGRERRLWRIDELDGRCYILILSNEQPDMTVIGGQFGMEGGSAVSREYDGFVSRIENGQIWRFRVCANPVHSVPDTNNKGGRGKVLAHVTVAQQRKWLMDKAEKNGFMLDADGFDVTGSQWRIFRKGPDKKQEVTILAVSFEGVLTVTDAELFRKVLTEGIGRGKAFGCGLLTLARAVKTV